MHACMYHTHVSNMHACRHTYITYIPSTLSRSSLAKESNKASKKTGTEAHARAHTFTNTHKHTSYMHTHSCERVHMTTLFRSDTLLTTFVNAVVLMFGCMPRAK